jgi:uncharacterized coiled-coil DUF342 family protein
MTDTELIPELEEKRARHNSDAERHKRQRDELNEKTREWADTRDRLNAQVRSLIEEANAKREMRDKLNGEVREVKAKRDEWNRKFNDFSDKVVDLKREKMPRSGQSIKKEAREAKDNAEMFHKQVSELAEKAQVEHDAMLKLYEEADKLRKEADEAQEKFIEAKLSADEEHREHIEHIRQVHDFDKIISGIRDRTRKARKEKDDDTAKREAEEIFDRFKSGEKLSTDDIMVLQKSGYM